MELLFNHEDTINVPLKVGKTWSAGDGPASIIAFCLPNLIQNGTTVVILYMTSKYVFDAMQQDTQVANISYPYHHFQWFIHQTVQLHNKKFKCQFSLCTLHLKTYVNLYCVNEAIILFNWEQCIICLLQINKHKTYPWERDPIPVIAHVILESLHMQFCLVCRSKMPDKCQLSSLSEEYDQQFI